jgi:hypothetical protein
VADLDQLLVHQLNTPRTRLLEELDLRLHQQVKRDFRYEEAWAWTSRVPNGCPNVLVTEVLGCVDRGQSVSKHIREDVVDPCTAR